MKCPNCGGTAIVCKTTRPHEADTIRRRVCKDCNHIFYTREYVMNFSEGWEAIAEFYRERERMRRNRKALEVLND